MLRYRWWLCVLMVGWGTRGAYAQAKVDFAREVRPVLEKACFECDGEKKPKGKLRLDSKALAMKGGNWGMVGWGTRGAGAQAKVDFAREVRPVLGKACFECHGEKKPKGKLRLDSKALAMKGGNSGMVIVPGKASESYLVKRIRGLGGEDR